MAIQSREQLKKYFRKGEYPTEGQFGSLIDSMRHREEGVGLTEVEGLPEALNGKIGRGEAGALRELLGEFGGFGALGFAGIDREQRVTEAGTPGRVELLAALSAGSVGVVYNTVSGGFLLRVEIPGRVRHYGAWLDVEGVAGRVVPRSADYRPGALLMAVEDGLGMFYTYSGTGEPRRLGFFGPVAEALDGTGALTPEVAVEHKANSVRLTFGAVDPGGAAGTRTAVIGAVGIKAGLMLPSHAQAISDLAVAVADLRGAMDELKDNLRAAAAMALEAQNRSDDNAKAIDGLRAAVAALGGASE